MSTILGLVDVAGALSGVFGKKAVIKLATPRIKKVPMVKYMFFIVMSVINLSS